MFSGLHFVRYRYKGQIRVWYVYAWRGGPLIMRSEGAKKPLLGQSEIVKLQAALDEVRRPDQSRFESLIREYRQSPEWKALAQSTRDLWGGQLDLIEARWGETPIAFWSDPRMVGKVLAWRDSRASTPRAADIGITALAQLLAFGKLRARVSINVADGIPTIYRPEGREEIIWTADDLDRFAVAALALNRPHAIDAIWLACLTGFRRADLVDVTLDEVGEHAIARTASKRSRGRRRRAIVPLVPETRQLLAELQTRHRAPGVRNLLVNSKGQPWQPGSLTQAINEIRDHAGIVEPANAALGLPERAKHLHDCRGTFVTHLCKQQLTNEEIARVVAWSPQNVDAIRRRYVDEAAVVVALGRKISGAL